MSKWELSVAWGDPEDISADVEIPTAVDLENIWNVAYMSVKDICEEAGLTQSQLATRFCIPNAYHRRLVFGCQQAFRLCSSDNGGMAWGSVSMSSISPLSAKMCPFFALEKIL